MFAGTAGTVTVDGVTDGPVGVTGMQFMVDGYEVVGDEITLSSPSGQTQVHVGHVTGSGAAYTATISSVLAGTIGLEKTNLGTLVLSGINSFTGDVAVTQGTLALSGGQAIDNGNAVVVAARGTLGLLDDETIASLAGAGAVDLGSSTLTTGAASSTLYSAS